MSWRNFFLVLDRIFKLHEKLPWKPLRRRALRKAKEWLLEHLERTEGLGAIYPAMVNSVFALRALGYSADDPVTAREIGHLAQFEIEEGDTLAHAALRISGLGYRGNDVFPSGGRIAARPSRLGQSRQLAA